MLDHDLSDSPITDIDHGLSTSDVMPLIQRGVRRSVPVLIHNHNASKPVWMQRALESAGFSATRVRFALLFREPSRFSEWLDDVRDNWDPAPIVEQSGSLPLGWHECRESEPDEHRDTSCTR